MRPRRLSLLLGFSLTLAATVVRAATPEDPYEMFNRILYAKQSNVDTKYFRPVTRLFHILTPGPVGVALHNLVITLSEPVVIINDLLQIRLKAAARDMVRLTANATFGLGSTIDVATKRGFPHHDNDFGITLGVWGAKSGPYLYLPVLGPTTVRDVVGMVADAGMNPFTFLRFPGRRTLMISSGVIGALDKRLYAEADLDAITADATDPYATLRSVYLQSREAEIRGEDAPPILPPLDDPAGPPPAPTAGQGAEAAPSPSGLADAAPAHAADTAAIVVAELDAPIATAQPVDIDRSVTRLAAAN